MKAILVSMPLVLLSLASMTQRAYASVSAPDPVVPVTLGQSVVALTGPWKFHIGDDPRWADPGFDDSQWETVDLTPTPQTTVPGVPIQGFVSGWEARGHPGYAGYAWYRMRVSISGAAGPLTLLSPEWHDGAFQVFANGGKVGSSGHFNGDVPVPDYDFPAKFTLPVSVHQPGPEGSTLIAFRFYRGGASAGRGIAGGMHGPPRLGLPGAATAVWQLQWLKVYRRIASALAAAVLYLVFALLIAMMFAFSRKDKILLWPLSACLLVVIHLALVFSTNSQWTSAVRMEALIGFVDWASWVLWLLTWWAYFGLQAKRWLFNTIIAVEIVHVVYTEFFTFEQWTQRVTHGLQVAKSVSDMTVGQAELLVIAVIAWMGRKRAERGQWALYLALLFYAIQALIPDIRLLRVRTSWQPFGVLVPMGLITACATLFFFSIVLFQQFRISLQRKQAMEDDVYQAKEVQRFLISEQMPKLSGWVIECEYRPAREVGGDFFQIIPYPHDGGLLIVTGDVTGKGLQAGMLVAMLVGAIRTESAHTSSPAQILAALNSRLLGREHAQATCLAIRIADDGRAILANAGHLPPYLNGEPVAMEGALPLGMIEAAQPSVMEFQLRQNDSLMLVSDGIIEATNADGALFGFERLQNLLRTSKTAGEVASAAQSFGQEDDISVIAITYTGASVHALA